MNQGEMLMRELCAVACNGVSGFPQCLDKQGTPRGGVSGSLDPEILDPGSLDPGSLDSGSLDPGSFTRVSQKTQAPLICRTADVVI